MTEILQQIDHPVASKHGIGLSILRLDLLHPERGGNKWYKLKYNVEALKKKGMKTLLTPGGAFSNHIAATAATGRIHSFKTIGIIRGEELDTESNPTLKKAKADGMTLKFISRAHYRRRNEPVFLEELKEEFGAFYFLPEGGANEAGLRGCAEIMQNIIIEYDFVVCAVGTGTTLAGIASTLPKDKQIIGIPVLANAGYLESTIEIMRPDLSNWKLYHGYDFGRYGSITPELVLFSEQFESETGIALDHVYTAKMMFGLLDLIEKGTFIRGEKIIALHTGGLQGNKSNTVP